MIHYLNSYIKGHICQLSHNKKPPARQLQTRINLNYRPLSRLSMDLKVMPRLHKGHKYILCIIDEVTSYLITLPIYQSKAEENRKCNNRAHFLKVEKVREEFLVQ